MNKDLTVGDPAKVLWKFCLPLFGSIIFQQLYNIADSFVAGKFIGENALAAVGNSYEITLIFIAFAFGCNIGCSVIVSQLFGARKLGEMKTAVYTTFISSAVVCAALMLAGTLGCDGLLRLINTPENVFADSKLYLDIYILGLPFVFFYNVATGIFSALGDSKTPFIFLAASSTSNIFMDILFVTAFKMGVAGVAWATFLCQGVSCVLAVLFVLRRLRGVETDEKSALFSFPLFCRIAAIAVPSILQQSFISVGNIVIQGVINSFGSGVMAGYSASVKLNNLVITSLTTLGNGISNFTAQNIGAGKMERVRSGFKAGLKLVWMLCLPIVALYLLGGRMLVNIFMNEPSEAAMASGVQFLRIVSPFYFVVSCKLVSDGVLRGAGLMKEFMAATFTDLILRVGLAIALSKALGAVGVWCAWPIGWSISMVMSVIFYRRGPWEKGITPSQRADVPRLQIIFNTIA
ncbi:MAG: MATE family efflux transporter [Christensenellales bacterium]